MERGEGRVFGGMGIGSGNFLVRAWRGDAMRW